jgi:hypothetical protein
LLIEQADSCSISQANIPHFVLHVLATGKWIIMQAYARLPVFCYKKEAAVVKDLPPLFDKVY